MTLRQDVRGCTCVSQSEEMNKSMSFLLACSFSQAKQVYFCVQGITREKKQEGITQNAIFLQEVGKYREEERTKKKAYNYYCLCPKGKSKNPLVLFLWASNAEW